MAWLATRSRGADTRRAGRALCEIRDECRTERAARQEIHAHLEALGAVLDPPDDERSDVAAEIADRINQCNADGRGSAGEKLRRHRPHGRSRSISAHG